PEDRGDLDRLGQVFGSPNRVYPLIALDERERADLRAGGDSAELGGEVTERELERGLRVGAATAQVEHHSEDRRVVVFVVTEDFDAVLREEAHADVVRGAA